MKKQREWVWRSMEVCMCALAGLLAGHAALMGITLPDEGGMHFVTLQSNRGNIEKTQSIQLRGRHRLLLIAEQNETVTLKATARQLGKSKPVAYTVFDTAGKSILSGTLTDRKNESITFVASASGTYQLVMDTDASVYVLSLSKRPFVVESPLHLMGTTPVLSFYVPKDTVQFGVFLRGGGSNECAGVDILDADSVKAESVETSENTDVVKAALKVHSAQAGRVWSVRLRKAATGTYEDVYLSFDGAIPPYAALSPETMMIEREISTEEMNAQYGVFLLEFDSRIRSKKGAPAYWRTRMEVRLADLRKAMAGVRTLAEQRQFRQELLGFEVMLDAFEKDRLTLNRCSARVIKALSNKRILPYANFDFGEFDAPLLVVATPGEYESASFVITPEEDMADLMLTVADLKTADGKKMSASSVDIKIVKAWYQDKGRGYAEETPARDYSPCVYAGEKILVPELLLHDDAMMHVDEKTSHNFIKLGGPDGTKYVCVSREDGVFVNDNNVPPQTMKDFPVWDSGKLLPVAIPAHMNKQFWVTVNVPKDAPDGIYEGRIQLTAKSGVIGSIPLKVRVLPFRFSESRFIQGIYYYNPDKTYYGDKQMAQFRKEMENLHAHAIDDNLFPYDILKDKEAFDIRRSVGIESKTMFYRGWKPVQEKTPDAVRTRAKDHIDALKNYGIQDVYFYGIDEATGDVLKSQRESWQAVHESGGKIFVAGYTARTHQPGNFALMGDLQDMLVCANYPDRQEARNWHSKGHKIICYANPQAGLESSDTYRRNFGFLIWQYEYDGFMTYIYHWGSAQDWKDKRWSPKSNETKRYLPCVWNDFCRKDGYKQHNMVYPTADGIVDTLQWEGYREAADDLRYMSTLLELIEQNETAAANNVKTSVEKAKSYLKDLKEKDVNEHKMDMDAIRADVISHILAIIKAKKGGA